MATSFKNGGMKFRIRPAFQFDARIPIRIPNSPIHELAQSSKRPSEILSSAPYPLETPMPHDQAYLQAEMKIEEARCSADQSEVKYR